MYIETPYIIMYIETPYITMYIETSYITMYIETPYITMYIETPYITIYIETPYITLDIETPYITMYIETPYIAMLNKSWQQHPTRRQLYGHLPPITKTIQARRTRHAGHCWRSKDEIVSDVLLWTPAYGQSKAGCNPEDLPKAMNDRETCRERVRDIRASRTS